MRISIESTDMITEMRGVTCRVWRGVTEQGTRVELLVPLVRVRRGENCDQLDKELREMAPAEVARRVGIWEDWSEPISLRQIL